MRVLICALSLLTVAVGSAAESKIFPFEYRLVQLENGFKAYLIKAGASGYLRKESAPDELITAIQRISGGRKYITSSLAERLADDVEPTAEKPLHDALSDREFEVFRMIAAGKTVTQIAEALFLNARTISTYRSRILEKMQMKTNAELIRYAIKHKILD